MQMLQGMAKLELPDEVIEESSECRVIKRYIPIGNKTLNYKMTAESERWLIGVRCLCGHCSLEL